MKTNFIIKELAKMVCCSTVGAFRKIYLKADSNDRFPSIHKSECANLRMIYKTMESTLEDTENLLEIYHNIRNMYRETNYSSYTEAQENSTRFLIIENNLIGKIRKNDYKLLKGIILLRLLYLNPNRLCHLRCSLRKMLHEGLELKEILPDTDWCYYNKMDRRNGVIKKIKETLDNFRGRDFIFKRQEIEGVLTSALANFCDERKSNEYKETPRSLLLQKLRDAYIVSGCTLNTTCFPSVNEVLAETEVVEILSQLFIGSKIVPSPFKDKSILKLNDTSLYEANKLLQSILLDINFQL